MTDTKPFSLRDPKTLLPLAALIVIVGLIVSFGTRYDGPEGASYAASLDAVENGAALKAFLVLRPELGGEAPETIVIENAVEEKKTQAFLENAKNGDVLFLFLDAELAFLYRPSTGQIIAEGPLHKGPPPAP
jgi:hypothetical protein